MTYIICVTKRIGHLFWPLIERDVLFLPVEIEMALLCPLEKVFLVGRREHKGGSELAVMPLSSFC